MISIKRTNWDSPGALEAEAWAQFGRIAFQNNPEVIKMFQEVFPNLFESAMIKLMEVM